MPSNSEQRGVSRPRARQRGITLIELIITIVVLAVGGAALLLVFNRSVTHSADPLVQEQAILIAEAYLEEILLKRFADPNTGNVCPTAEGSRAAYDNVCDYDGLDSDGAKTGCNSAGGACDQLGNVISGLERYRVTVSVDRSPGLDLNGITNSVAIRVLHILVTISHPGLENNIVMGGYRVNYECNLSTDPGCAPET